MSKSSIILFVSCLLLPLLSGGCSDERTRDLNRMSKQVFDAVTNSKRTAEEGLEKVQNLEAPSMPTKEDFVEASDAFVDKVSTATAEKVAAKLSKDASDTAKSVEDGYSEAKQTVRETKDSARGKIRWIKRRIPRNQREANKMTYSLGQSWMTEFQSWLDGIAKKGTFRVDKRSDKRNEGRKK